MTSSPPPLRCLGGATPPDDLESDLQRLLDLPEAARKEFWQVLGAYLEPTLDERAEATIVAYCDRHGLRPDQIAPAVKATRFLFQSAAQSNVAPEELATDLHALCNSEESGRELAALMLPWLEDFLPKLRRAAIHQTLLNHGKLVTSMHWRLDRITSSDQAEEVNTSLALLTFNYREGDKLERVTLQLLPDQVDELRRAAGRMLG